MKNTQILFVLKMVSIIIFPSSVLAQEENLKLDLPQCIELATNASLQTFKSKHLYLSSYWAFRSFKAGRLPSISLEMIPVQYNSNFIKRYDYNQNIEVYRQQQSTYSAGGLSITQNLDITGGTFIIDSELGYMRNYGGNAYSQFTSVPIRIGYSQALFGFNNFKWEKKTEPLKYEKAKKEFLYAQEEIAEMAVQYFFNLAMAQANYTLALENVSSTDSLYATGMERSRISVISHADIQTLKLDCINANNSLQNAQISLKKAKNSFVSFLNMDTNMDVQIKLPNKIYDEDISEDEALQYVTKNNPDILSYTLEILESEKEVDRMKKSSNFNANFSASVGFNQASNNFSGAYRDLLQQDMVRVGISIPILDWGVRKGKVNMAKSNLDIARLSVQQRQQSLEQDVSTAVEECNTQKDLIRGAEEALSLAISAYNITKQRFIIGKADISSLTLSLSRRREAQRNYIQTIGQYWVSYYKIRKLTLYDFQKKESLSYSFDKILNLK